MNKTGTRKCPGCGAVIEIYRQPKLTVDIVIFSPGGEVCFIERKNPPQGYALPGGFVDYGETLEKAAMREAKEETGLEVGLTGLLGVYSDPARDLRHHSVTIAYLGESAGRPAGADDAARAFWQTPETPPSPLLFDHNLILNDALKRKKELG